jgi:hypothetical protein
MSLRQRRQAVELPSVDSSMELIDEATSASTIHTVFKHSCKLLRDDEEAIADYWMNYEYDPDNKNHQTILAFVFAQVGLQNELVKDFLDTVDRDRLFTMGVVRVKNHYRIRTGIQV